jgi:hypothetical protein
MRKGWMQGEVALSHQDAARPAELDDGGTKRGERDIPHGDSATWQPERTNDRFDPVRAPRAAEVKKLGLQTEAVLLHVVGPSIVPRRRGMTKFEPPAWKNGSGTSLCGPGAGGRQCIMNP